MIVGVLNLMPNKQEAWDQIKAWTQLASPVLIPLKLHTHTPKFAPDNWHLYHHWDQIEYDHLIVTGAPIEHLPWSDVTYWTEYSRIVAERRYQPTTWLCWAAMAAAYANYGVPKGVHHKISGMYPYVAPINNELGLTEIFWQPVSRSATVHLTPNPALQVIAGSTATGTAIAHTKHNLYLFNHPEYAPTTLKDEYDRDVERYSNQVIQKPCNYNPTDTIWQPIMQTMIATWLNKTT